MAFRNMLLGAVKQIFLLCCLSGVLYVVQILVDYVPNISSACKSYQKKSMNDCFGCDFYEELAKAERLCYADYGYFIVLFLFLYIGIAVWLWKFKKNDILFSWLFWVLCFFVVYFIAKIQVNLGVRFIYTHLEYLLNMSLGYLFALIGYQVFSVKRKKAMLGCHWFIPCIIVIFLIFLIFLA